MEILVKLGDIFGAEKLIPVESAHVSGISYKTAGDAAIEFLRELKELGAKASIPATTNPCGFDERLSRILDLPEELISAQRELVSSYEELGLQRTLTCVPYYQHRPEPGSHLAWAESSAVVYANSVLNACTNREGAPSALAAAIVGKTPDHGLHRPENRKPGILIHVDFKPKDEVELWSLGFLVGKICKDKIPLLEGLKGLADWELKGLGAAMASGGMTALFHLAEAHGEPVAEGIEEEVSLGKEDVLSTIEGLSSSNEPDLFFIGCPHCSEEELELIASLLKGRKVGKGVHLWICTSRYIKERRPDLVEAIEGAGGLVICDTCVVVSWVERLGVDTVATNSPKAAYYLPGLSGLDVRLMSLRECLRSACTK